MFSSPFGEDVTHIVLYDDGTSVPKVISGSAAGVIKLHSDNRSATSNCKVEFYSHTDSVLGLAVNDEFQCLASCGNDGNLVFFDLRIMKPDQTISTLPDPVTTVEWFTVPNGGDGQHHEEPSGTSTTHTTAHTTTSNAGRGSIETKLCLFCGDASGFVSMYRTELDAHWRKVWTFRQRDVLPFYEDVNDVAFVKVLHIPPSEQVRKTASVLEEEFYDKVHLFVGDIVGKIRAYDITHLFFRREGGLLGCLGFWRFRR